MPLDIRKLWRENQHRNYDLHRDHINPQYTRVLKTIGFDRSYVRGEGPYLWDAAGTRYLDFLSGYGVFTMGRNNPVIRDTLVEFLKDDYPNLVHFDASVLSGLLAEELKKRIGRDLGIVYFTNSGTESTETAIKFARCATKRPGILYCRKAFHGLSNGALTLNGDESFRDGFEPLLPDCVQIPFNDLPALDAALAKRNIAAFIVETIQGKGVNLPHPGYHAEAAALCRKYGTLYVADEIQSGMGRTGTFLALDQEGAVEPDMVLLSKALSGGFVPVGAVLCRKWIYDGVFSSLDRAIVHSSTFGQTSYAMVAALATLQWLDESDAMQNAVRLGQRFRDGLELLKTRFEFIKDIRHRGLMIGIEFGEPKSLLLKAQWAIVHKMSKDLFPQAIVIPLLDDHKILTQVAGHHIDVVKLLPPLVINDADVDWFLKAFESVMVNLHKFPGPAWDVLFKLGKNAVTHRPREHVAN